MNSLAVLDPASVIWDENDFRLNKSKYYQLTEDLMLLIDLIEDNPIRFLIREELIDEIIYAFPLFETDTSIPELYDFSVAMQQFLAKILDCSESFNTPRIDSISCTPNIIQSHYNPRQNKEIQKLLSELYLETSVALQYSRVVFFTFKCNWSSLNSILEINVAGNCKEITALIDIVQWSWFFNSLKLTFQPNPKHHPISGWESRLLIPDQICQALLETAIGIDDTYTGKQPLFNLYDQEMQYIAFKAHELYKYHGYPVSDKSIPSKLKKKIVGKRP